MRQIHECAKIMLSWLKITRLINVLQIIKDSKYKLTWAVFLILPTELDCFLLLGYWLEVNRTDNILTGSNNGHIHSSKALSREIRYIAF